MDIPEILYEPLVRAALAEDIGPGDITTRLCVPEDAWATARLLAKSSGVVAGLDVVALAFRLLDPNAEWISLAQDGDIVLTEPVTLAEISGNARALLTAERVALNFIQRMSGIATITARYVEIIHGTKARIADTRKTTPGLRVLEKYAVRIGGGYNHRFGLYDSILIKDNHIRAAGGIKPAAEAARAGAPHTMKLEVEVTSLREVAEALAVGADIILLDNMDITMLREAVKAIAGLATTEASGGINESTAAAIAHTGVDVLSVGALTHSAPAMDISLDFTP